MSGGNGSTAAVRNHITQISAYGQEQTFKQDHISLELN